MKIFLQIWSAVGPLVGLLFGWVLTRSWQKTQWTLESKKIEYQELLSILSRSVRRIMANSPHLWSEGFAVTSADNEARQVSEANDEARSAIEDRIFIYTTIQSEKILERWGLIAGVREEGIVKFLEYWKALHKTLVHAAHKDLGIKN